jgi:hypothetical protein
MFKGEKLPTKPLPMEKKTPLPEVEKHDLTIGAFRQRKGLRMDITRVAIKLLFWHRSEDGLDSFGLRPFHGYLQSSKAVLFLD